MASGFGVYTKTGRCYGMWQLYASCQVSTDDVSVCKPAFEDYFECIHGVKEVCLKKTIIIHESN
jgi:hypothetical protein